MSRNNKGTSQIPKLSFQELQLQIEEFRKKRDDLNQRTKDLINDLQEIDNQIEAKLNVAKENYQKKRDYWNSKVKKLKDKKNEYKKILDGFIEEKKNIIVFDGEHINGNTLFRPGIIGFSQNLVPKDIVLIFNKQEEKLIGLGSLIVGSNYIKNSKTGKILNVYEKI